eukprot:8992619-Heterocapsa_arctica.AAC.1
MATQPARYQWPAGGGGETDARSSRPAGSERPGDVLINYAMSCELYIVRPRICAEALEKMI